MTGWSLSTIEEAELYRLGLLCRYFSVADAIRWADSVLESAAQPDYAFIEVSMAGREHEEDIARYLDAVVPGADTEARKHDLLALLRRKLIRDTSAAQGVARSVMMLGQAAADEELEHLGDRWDDEINLATTGVYGSIEPIVEEMRKELGRSKLSTVALNLEAWQSSIE
jgi:hypothetical protein